MSIITRFSPSPTGFLHIGNARTAIINHLFVLKNQGVFLLRIDDTDFERSKDEYREQIIEDLTWLGIKWEKMYRQADRLDVYEKVKNELIAKGRLYPCYESEEELSVRRKVQLARGIPPIYDRAALKLTADEKAKFEAEGRAPYYRFLLNDEEISWDDRIKSKISFKSRAFSDPVLVRASGSPTYTFCSVVDDIEFNITDVIRGEDHVTNTAVQIQIFQALSDKLPQFSHLALLRTKDGEISKRFGGFEIKELRKAGIDSMAINSYLGKIGTSENVAPYTDINDIVTGFDFGKFNQAAINYDPKDLEKINHKVIALYSYAQIQPKLAELGIEIDETFWHAIRENINSLIEIKIWQEICNGDFKAELSAEDSAFCKIAADLLPTDWQDESWKQWLNDITAKTGRKGRELFHPIRLAITNQESGPELKTLIPLIGLEKIKERLC